MAFVLPTVIFVIFAAIFSGAIGDRIRIHLGLARPRPDRHHAAPRAGAGGRPVPPRRAARRRPTSTGPSRRCAAARSTPPWSCAATSTPAPTARRTSPWSSSRTRPGPWRPRSRSGQLQRVLNESLPDVVLARIVADVERSGKIGPDERAFLNDAFAEQRARKEPFSFASLVERRSTASGAANERVGYYAGRDHGGVPAVRRHAGGPVPGRRAPVRPRRPADGGARRARRDRARQVPVPGAARASSRPG